MSNQEPTEESCQSQVAKPATLALCHQVIEELSTQIESLNQRLLAKEEALELLLEKLKLNSRNSSKPPSSDGPGGPNRAARRASARKRGAQKGHPGAYREMLPQAAVDAVHECPPPDRCECGAGVEVRGQALRHQVFDVPQVKARVDEYRLYSGVCAGCGKVHQGVLPKGVPRGQMGPRALSIVGYLGTHCHLTQGKIRDLMAQVLGVDFSLGAVSQAHGKVSAALATPVAQAVQAMASAPVVHVDETRYPREGAGMSWSWGLVTPKVVTFSTLPSRARYVFEGLMGSKPEAIVVSDRYAVYDSVDVSKRQVCWAHLLRDFTRISERSGLAGRIGRRLLGLGYVLFRWRERGRNDVEPLQRRLRAALERGCAQTECSRTAKTCANLLRLWPALWTFTHRPDVEPTNNAAEQALRGIVLKRKISGPTRSRRGEEFIARGFTVLESCRRQGRNMLDFLHESITAWISQATGPSLVPTG